MEYPYYKKVLFCTDFSDNADYAFDFAYGIARRDAGIVYILHVLPDSPQGTLLEMLIPRDIVKKLHRVIKEDVKRDYKEHYVKKIGNNVPFQIVTKTGREDEEILTFAKQENVDIIVMDRRGRTEIERVFFWDVAEKALRYSPFPVFFNSLQEKARAALDQFTQ